MNNLVVASSLKRRPYIEITAGEAPVIEDTIKAKLGNNTFKSLQSDIKPRFNGKSQQEVESNLRRANVIGRKYGYSQVAMLAILAEKLGPKELGKVKKEIIAEYNSIEDKAAREEKIAFDLNQVQKKGKVTRLKLTPKYRRLYSKLTTQYPKQVKEFQRLTLSNFDSPEELRDYLTKNGDVLINGNTQENIAFYEPDSRWKKLLTFLLTAVGGGALGFLLGASIGELVKIIFSILIPAVMSFLWVNIWYLGLIAIVIAAGIAAYVNLVLLTHFLTTFWYESKYVFKSIAAVSVSIAAFLVAVIG